MDILKKAAEKNVKIHFPVDYITGNKFSNDSEVGTATDASGIPDGWQVHICAILYSTYKCSVVET